MVLAGLLMETMVLVGKSLLPLKRSIIRMVGGTRDLIPIIKTGVGRVILVQGVKLVTEFRIGVNQVLQIRVNHLVGVNQVLIRVNHLVGMNQQMVRNTEFGANPPNYPPL